MTTPHDNSFSFRFIASPRLEVRAPRELCVRFRSGDNDGLSPAAPAENWLLLQATLEDVTGHAVPGLFVRHVQIIGPLDSPAPPGAVRIRVE